MYALFDGQKHLGKTQITDSFKKFQPRRLLVAAVAYTVPCRPVFEVLGGFATTRSSSYYPAEAPGNYMVSTQHIGRKTPIIL